MMVEDERSSGAGSGMVGRRDPDRIIKESRAVLKDFLVLLDELDVAIKDTREEAKRDPGGYHRWSK